MCCQLLNGSVRDGSERRQGTDIVNNYLLDLLRDRTEVFTFGQIRNYDFFYLVALRVTVHVHVLL